MTRAAALLACLALAGCGKVNLGTPAVYVPLISAGLGFAASETGAFVTVAGWVFCAHDSPACTSSVPASPVLPAPACARPDAR